MMFLASSAQAVEPPNNLYKGLIAEAVGEGYEGMFAVACCVRNRLEEGMNTGLCGLKRKDIDSFVKRQGKRYTVIAQQIIVEVFENNAPDVTNGALYFENIEAFGVPYFVIPMNLSQSAKIGLHTFYKK